MSYISHYFHTSYILKEFYNQPSRYNSLAKNQGCNMNAKMKARTSVQEHYAEIHGTIIDELREKRKKSKSYLLFLGSSLLENDSSPWIIDSGANNHVCSSLEILRSNLLKGIHSKGRHQDGRVSSGSRNS